MWLMRGELIAYMQYSYVSVQATIVLGPLAMRAPAAAAAVGRRSHDFSLQWRICWHHHVRGFQILGSIIWLYGFGQYTIGAFV